MIGTAGGKDDIRTGRHGFLVGNFGIGIGQRKHNGVGGHGTDHFPAKHIALGQSQKYICSTDGFLQRVHRVGGSKLQLHGIHVRPGSVQHTLGIAHINMAGRHPQQLVQPATGNCRGPCPVHHDTHLINLLSGNLQAVQQSGPGDDGRTMLIIMHHGNGQLLLQPVLNGKTLRGLNVLQVDAPKGRCDGLDRFHKGIHIGLVHFDIKHINIGKHLEEQTLTFHNRLPGQRADISKAQHSSTIGNNGHQISLCGVFISILRVFLNLQTRFGHTRGISQRKVRLGTGGFGGNHLNLSGASLSVVPQSFFFGNFRHTINI